jgi:hypothetical protein
MDKMKLWLYLYGNRVAIGAMVLNLTTAAVKTAPTPGTPWTWETIYAWVYDWFHQVFNITNTRLTTAPIVTPPVNKEESVLSPK